MFASPIIPGRAYRVKYQGCTFTVPAKNGADAICCLLHLVKV